MSTKMCSIDLHSAQEVGTMDYYGPLVIWFAPGLPGQPLAAAYGGEDKDQYFYNGCVQESLRDAAE